MTDLIEIKNIDGLFTNADQEDIQANFATALKNFKALNGKIVKTFGFGDLFSLDVLDIIETGYWVNAGHVWNNGQWWLNSGESLTKSIGVSIINLVTYFNQNASGGSGNGSGDGYVFIAVAIDSASGQVTLYYWTGIDWENITNLVQNTPDTFYHVYAKNPIIQQNEILRLLPGGEGQVGTGNNDAIGIWLGWINRDYFDKLYEHQTDYDEGFYLYNNYPERPNITTNYLNVVTEQLDGGDIDADTFFYKFSYVYDGIIESLLSEEVKVDLEEDKIIKFTFTISTATFNKRLTAIKIYRSEVGNIGDPANEMDSSYDLIQIIDLVREPGSYYGIHPAHGLSYVYISNISDGIDLTKSNYFVKLGGTTYYNIKKPTDANQKVFECSGGSFGSFVDSAWQLGYYSYGIPTTLEGDTDGGWAGNKIIILNEDEEFAENSLIGSIIILQTTPGNLEIRFIDDNNKRAIHITENPSLPSGGYFFDWRLLTGTSGAYYFDESGTDIYVYFFDNNITEGETYPLLNEPSIKTNGKFALTNLDRLWQFNIVLDPGGKNEVHPDWLSYSELDQYDVNPVSNVIKITDASGGEGTGLVTSFNAILPLKQSSIHKLIISDASDSTTWQKKILYNKKGNIAKQGFIQIDSNVYFCATDGIYELDVNIDSAIDDTLFIKNRISEPINDVYLALNDISEKPLIRCGYDKINTEIIFRFTSTSIWAFNITTKMWREIDTAKTCDIFAYDQYDNLMVFNEADDQLYSINALTGESVGCVVAAKLFNISGYTGGRLGLVRSVVIRYMSEVALMVRTYLNGSSDCEVCDELAPALTQANWDTVAGWDLSGSTLNHNSDGAGAISPLTAIPVIAGQVYKVVITLSACTVGNCTYTLGGTGGTSLAAATTYTDYIIASTTGDLIFTPNDAAARFTISAVSVKQIVGGSLAISSSIATVKMAIRRRCHSFKVEIADLTESTSETEIYNIKIETD